MLLTLDIGNTNIKTALFDGNHVSEFTAHSGVNEALKYIDKIKFNEAAICSVNPPVEKLLVDNISVKTIKIFRASIQNKFNFKVNYKTPQTLGVDRVCSAVGALDIASKKKILSENQYLLTVDFGTATTINIVSPAREFLGGLIAPGIKTMLYSLNEKTAQLPFPELKNYESLIGNSTDASIVSGVISATIGMIGETINHLSSESDQNLPLIFVSGGNAEYILQYLKYKFLFEEALVLKGLKVVYDLNK